MNYYVAIRNKYKPEEILEFQFDSKKKINLFKKMMNTPYEDLEVIQSVDKVIEDPLPKVKPKKKR